MIIENSLAQDSNHTTSGKTGSNTFMTLGTVTGGVSNVVPSLANGLISTAGSGYLTTPTITISAPTDGSSTAVANVVGEDTNVGGNINAKYISRRVTLEDEFDASDLKVILNAYKEWGIKSFNKFNGMWSFAIWDSKKEELFFETGCTRIIWT